MSWEPRARGKVEPQTRATSWSSAIEVQAVVGGDESATMRIVCGKGT